MYKTIFFGDSFTNCNGLSQLDTWPTMVCSMLNQQFEDRVNLQFEISVASQENTRGALERLQRDILFANPDILTVHTYGLSEQVPHGNIRSILLEREIRFGLKEFSNRFISGANLPSGEDLDDSVRSVLGVN